MKKENQEWKKLAKEFAKEKNNQSFNQHLETLSPDEHNLLIEELSSNELAKIYDDINDLEVCDLIDFFNLERSYGRD